MTIWVSNLMKPEDRLLEIMAFGLAQNTAALHERLYFAWYHVPDFQQL
jgi:hypothetical protein